MAHATVTGSMGKTRVARAKEFIAQHQLIAFFALTYAFSWPILFLIPQSNAFSTVGNFGPFFAAVVISATIAPKKLNGSRARRWALFALVFAVALSVWILFDWSLHAGRGWLPGAASAALVAFLVSGPLAGRRGVRDLLGPLATWRVGWSSYAAAVLLGPAIFLLPIGLDLAVGGHLPPRPRGAPSLELVSLFFAYILFFGGGFTEEPGWRGFALPRLQSRFSPLVASIILGLVWAFWHTPYYFTGLYTATSNTGPAAVVGILSRFIWVVPLAIIFTWLYNRAGRSLLIVILLHTAFNTATAVVPLSPRASVLFLGTTWAIALVVVGFGRMWRKQQSDVPTLSELTEPLPTSEEPIEAAPISPMLTTREPPAASPDPPGRFRPDE